MMRLKLALLKRQPKIVGNSKINSNSVAPNKLNLHFKIKLSNRIKDIEELVKKYRDKKPKHYLGKSTDDQAILTDVDSYDSFLRYHVNNLYNNEVKHKEKLSKFTLPFVKRIVPKDKISEILKYGENSIRMIELKTKSMMNRSNQDIHSYKSSEYFSRNDMLIHLHDDFNSKRNEKSSQIGSEIKLTKRNNCTFGTCSSSFEKVSKYTQNLVHKYEDESEFKVVESIFDYQKDRLINPKLTYLLDSLEKQYASIPMKSVSIPTLDNKSISKKTNPVRYIGKRYKNQCANSKLCYDHKNLKDKLTHLKSKKLHKKSFASQHSKLSPIESYQNMNTYKTIDTDVSQDRLTRSLAVGSPVKEYKFVSLELDDRFQQEQANEYA